MKKPDIAKPSDCRIRRLAKKKLDSKNKLSITHNSSDSRAKNQVLATKNKVRPTDLIGKNQDGRIKYKQIVDIFKYGGGHNEADTYLIHWGVSPVVKGLLLAYAEYDALTSGVCDA
jgi:hypothetical protein